MEMKQEINPWTPPTFANDVAVQPDTELTALCKRLEHFETPEWAAREILKHEILTNMIVDPCCGSGVLYRALKAELPYDHAINNWDIHDWGFPCKVADFLACKPEGDEHQNLKAMNWTAFMNPPFSKAEAFVEKCFELGARKIVCFQRFSWYEGAYDTGKKRGQWWEKYPPNRIYICGDRATCWRHDIPAEQRIGGTTTAHAFFVWEQGQPAGTLTGRIYK